jgi:hypothetical protein
LAGRSFDIAYRTVPGAPAIGKHFAIEVRVCRRSGDAQPRAIRVDAFMPEHNHGMNYKPTVRMTADGYRADGLMLHMPGQWEIRFDIDDPAGNERITHLLHVQ